MKEKLGLSREAFLTIAETAGLDIRDPHMDELYRYLQNVLPSLQRPQELDLTGTEPFMPFIAEKGLAS
jgi:Asp-tRNA(Asn)/Glu-tRNA(Gln) amidotransferase C subunit